MHESHTTVPGWCIQLPHSLLHTYDYHKALAVEHVFYLFPFVPATCGDKPPSEASQVPDSTTTSCCTEAPDKKHAVLDMKVRCPAENGHHQCASQPGQPAAVPSLWTQGASSYQGQKPPHSWYATVHSAVHQGCVEQLINQHLPH